MKKALSYVLLVILVFSANTSLFAEKARVIRTETTESTTAAGNPAVAFQSVRAITQGCGALIEWQMSVETDNMGFYVYRIGGKDGSQLVNPIMLSGVYAAAGPSTKYGEKYQLYDRQGSLGSSYQVQSFTLAGDRVASPVFTTEYSRAAVVKNDRFANANVEGRSLEMVPELQSTVDAAIQEPNLNVHRWVVSQPGAEIGIKKEGLYRVTISQLAAAGFNTAASSANWRLFLNGNEQAITIGAGDQYIEFYAKTIDTIESDTQNYYLIADIVAGRRIGTKVMTPIGGNVVSPNYRVAAEKKERTQYLPRIKNGDLDNYWGRIVTNDVTSIPFTLTALDTTIGKANVTVKMQGWSSTPHNVTVIVNGHTLGAMTGNNADPYQSEDFLIPRAFLLEGNNTLQLATALSSDYSVFDSITIKYARKYAADQNKVAFATPGYKKVNLGGFTSPNVRLFDITFDGTPIEVIGLPIQDAGGTFGLTMPAHRPGLFLGIEDTAILQTTLVAANNPSTLSLATNAADMVIISHSAPDFMAASEAWAAYRRTAAGGGFTVKVVDIADIYDEFSYGVTSASAINGFLSLAYNTWQTPPRYVMLVGDATHDPRNYEGFGNWNLVPTKIVNLIFEESGSDEALGDFDNDGIAEMAIGRVPARNAGTVSTVLAKTIKFETPGVQSLDRGVLCSHGGPDSSNDFQAMCLELKAVLPENTSFTLVSAVGGHQENLNQINRGKYMVNFAGHGASGTWASSDFFSLNDVPSLTNSELPSVFTMLTCFNGYFIRTEADALVEPLLASPNGGAVAAWASTTETTTNFQLPMATRFYHGLGVEPSERLGDMVRDAKLAVPFGTDVRFSYALFGDPALKMQ